MILTVGDFFVRVQVFVNVHGKIHHVRVAEEVQLSLKQFLFIVNLQVQTNGDTVCLFYKARVRLYKKSADKPQRYSYRMTNRTALMATVNQPADDANSS